MKRLLLILIYATQAIGQTSQPARRSGPNASITSGLSVKRSSTTQLNLRARFIPLYDSKDFSSGLDGNGILVSSVNTTVSLAVEGAGGVSSATSRATSTWYAILLMSSGQGDVAGLIESTSTFTASNVAGAPTLPLGYRFFRRVAFCRTNATGSGEWIPFYQIGHWAVVDMSDGVIQASGDQGSSAAWDDGSAYIPPTIRRVVFYASAAPFTTNLSVALFVTYPYVGASLNLARGYDFGRNDADHLVRVIMTSLADENQGVWWALQDGGYTTIDVLAVAGWFDPL